ncbi:MAG: S1/P1 nuclease [Muribaculaceae bacterium]|nr:S1/P1 nuclease [Muribaculaceae bacterium]
MKHLFLSAIALAATLSASAWSQKGHDVTAYIAEQHLTERTRAAVDSILDGKSMVYWANWLDNASHNSDYAYTKTWHYRNIDAMETYESMPRNEKGDVTRAVAEQISLLRDSTLTPEQSALAMKILAHCMGDLHQPMHMGRLSDLGGNKVKLKFFNNETNLHHIWDSNILESGHKWSYTEWQQQIDRATPEEIVVITEGNPESWGKETYGIAKQVYVYFQPGMRVSYNHIARWTPVIEQQLLRAGLRLAHVLNSIYDPQ